MHFIFIFVLFKIIFIIGVIISGFSNIGKSYLIKNKNINCIDFDTCYFKKINNWINIYVECVLALKEKYDYVLITTYGEVLNELDKRNIEYHLIYPIDDCNKNKNKNKIVLNENEYLSDVIYEIK